MRALIWGCRGSLPTPGEDTLRYGGNTSCVEVELADGTLLVLDAGSGFRALGLKVAAENPRPIHLCLTHLHLDHIEGLGFFAPIWREETELHIWGPPSTTRGIAARVARYFSPPLFPMQLGDVPAHLHFHDVPAHGWHVGSAFIQADRVSHPGPTLGYRIEEDGGALAYIPDHEPALGRDLRRRETDWISGFDIAAGVDILIHDAQYSEAEYESKLGWGHSSVADTVAFARLAGVGRLVLAHHDPLHSDEEVEALGERAGELWGEEGDAPEPGYEGMVLELEAPAGARCSSTPISALTTRGSNCAPASARSSASATSSLIAGRYGRSLVIALKASQQATIRASKGISSAAAPSG
jgi:phosphoribosyl 1,2-cyclic phosphodiesterase